VGKVHPVVAAGDGLPVDDAGARAQVLQPVHDQGEAVRRVATVAAVELDPVAVLPGDDPKAVVLDLMPPYAASGRLFGLRWQAWQDEAILHVQTKKQSRQRRAF
jgi:hypothetical protein